METQSSLNSTTLADPDVHKGAKGFKRFPDYLIVGQINLHKSAECAASLARYIDKQWDFFRINKHGIISSKQLEINRAPEKYGMNTEGNPISVSEWTKIQKEKLAAKRKELAEAETLNAQDNALSGGEGRGRGRRGSRGRGRGRGKSTSKRRSRSKSKDTNGSNSDKVSGQVGNVVRGDSAPSRGQRRVHPECHRGLWV